MKLTSIFAIIIGVQFALTHIAATYFRVYFEIPWFDSVMHFFGGVVIAFFIFALRDVRVLNRKFVTSWTYWSVAVATILISWEVFEWTMIFRIKDDFVLDTFFDLLFGILGCLLGKFIGHIMNKLEI